MTITKIFLLLVCAFVLVLLLSTIFNKHHRIIMWSAAIVFFIGTLLLIGLGIIDPVKDNHPDPVFHRPCLIGCICIRSGKVTHQT